MPRESLVNHTTHVWESSSGFVMPLPLFLQFLLRLFANMGLFKCNWETEDNAPKIDTNTLKQPSSSASSIKGSVKGDSTAPAVSLSVPPHGTDTQSPKLTISYLTEQTSHHPPVSAFHITCPEKGISARGYDQITAKFTGTSVKVLPGEFNEGIFITLDKRDGETYQLTHPAAYLGGILRGALSVSVGDVACFTCPKTKLKTILNYVDEGWLGRTTNKIDGIIFKYDPENDNKTRVQDVPEADILARISGPWKEKVVFTLGPRLVVSTCAHLSNSTRLTAVEKRPR